MPKHPRGPDRATMRNAARVAKNLRYWKYTGQAWHRANEWAKLPERAQQCAAARTAVANAAVNCLRSGTRHDIRAILREFWLTQEKTRVVSRILRELRA